MRVRRARTSCDTSLTILALSLGDSVVNHLARRCEGAGARQPGIRASPGPGANHVKRRRRARGEGRGGTTRDGGATNHFALAGQQNQIPGQAGVSRAAAHDGGDEGLWRTGSPWRRRRHYETEPSSGGRVRCAEREEKREESAGRADGGRRMASCVAGFAGRVGDEPPLCVCGGQTAAMFFRARPRRVQAGGTCTSAPWVRCSSSSAMPPCRIPGIPGCMPLGAGPRLCSGSPPRGHDAMAPLARGGAGEDVDAACCAAPACRYSYLSATSLAACAGICNPPLLSARRAGWRQASKHARPGSPRGRPESLKPPFDPSGATASASACPASATTSWPALRQTQRWATGSQGRLPPAPPVPTRPLRRASLPQTPLLLSATRCRETHHPSSTASLHGAPAMTKLILSTGFVLHPVPSPWPRGAPRA